MSAFTLTAGQPPSPPNLASNPSAPGLIGGVNLTLQIISATGFVSFADVFIYTYTSAVEVLDEAAFERLSVRPSVGWSAPRRLRIDTTTPVAVGGSSGTCPWFPDGSITSSSEGVDRWRPSDGPRDVTFPPQAPRFVPPKPIAFSQGGPLFVSIDKTDAAAGTAITFSVGGS